DAKTDAELAQILKPLNERLSEYEQNSRDLERELISKDHGLSDELAQSITGDSAADWAARAKKLPELAASGGSGQLERQRGLRGRNGAEPNRDFDPAERARRHFQAHRD